MIIWLILFDGMSVANAKAIYIFFYYEYMKMVHIYGVMREVSSFWFTFFLLGCAFFYLATACFMRC